jgi:hypothetical protein
VIHYSISIAFARPICPNHDGIYISFNHLYALFGTTSAYVSTDQQKLCAKQQDLQQFII